MSTTLFPSNLVRGAILGLALGDALGAPHEYRNILPITHYTGQLIYPLTLNSRWHGTRTGEVGQITDDTEMTIALAQAIIQGHGHYHSNLAITAYQTWANSGCPFMGKNTRSLFQGVTTIRGYNARRDHALQGDPAKYSASNGCLMRASPLALLPEDEWIVAVRSDCILTNFPELCIQSVLAYICALRALLQGHTPSHAITCALEMSTIPEVIQVITDARDRVPRDVEKQKGWILHSLYCAFYSLSSPIPDFQTRIDEIIRFGGDTDTNAAIAGVLIGAHIGEERMKLECRTGPNISILMAYNPETSGILRPKIYSVGNLLELVMQINS